MNELDWLAIVFAALVYFILGAVWFTPLLGNMYDKALGVERQKSQKWPTIYSIGPFISSVIVTVATSVLVYALDIHALSNAVLLGLIVGGGYAMCISFNNAINPITPRPLMYGAVTGGYHLAGIGLIAAMIFGMK